MKFHPRSQERERERRCIKSRRVILIPLSFFLLALVFAVVLHIYTHTDICIYTHVLVLCSVRRSSAFYLLCFSIVVYFSLLIYILPKWLKCPLFALIICSIYSSRFICRFNHRPLQTIFTFHSYTYHIDVIILAIFAINV